MFFNNNVRDYEVSIWTLQDSFITVLKHSKQESKGAIQNPIMNIKNDGTLEFSFSLPMYIYDGPDRIENPIWYNVRNGTILSDLRKIKVIFNKLTQLEEVFEFVITQVTERHENDELMCDVQCEGLAFHELGKIGYRISLNQDDYIQEWQDWSNSDKSTPEPKNNIDYWLKKVLKDSKWRYTIAMDWSSYDGMVTVEFDSAELPLVDHALVDIARLFKESEFHGKVIPYEELDPDERNRVNARRTELGLRRNDIIYEDEYVSSWQNSDGVMMPKTVERRREKCRLINKEGSNIYNLTQTIAETFGVYCKYVYHYDEDYHIIDREIVFYNNVLHDAKGEYQLTYPYDTKHIERTMDGTDIVTKMYVQNLTDANMESGYATIMDTDANSSGEDYLLNFDYLYSIGTISQDQYDEIPKHLARLHDFNEEIKPLELRLIALQNEYAEVSAAATIAKNAISLDTERISATDDLRNAITEGTGQIEVTIYNPDQLIVQQDEYGMYYTTIRKEGVIPSSILLYKKYDSKTLTVDEKIESFSIEYDEYNNATGKLTYLSMEETDSRIIYAMYSYSPSFVYDNIRKVWLERKLDDEKEYEKQSARARVLDGEKDPDGNRLTPGLIQETEITLDILRKQKQKEIKHFERLMGPALREGTWKPEDDYAQYGEKYSEDFVFDYTTQFNDSIISGGWDNELFDDEPVNYYEEGVTKEKVYYPCVMVAEGGLAEEGHFQFERFTDAFLKQLTGENITVTDLSFIFKDLSELSSNPLDYRYFPIGSSSQLGFVRRKGHQETIPVLMITGVKTLVDPSIIKNEACIGYLKTVVKDDGSGITQEIVRVIPNANIVWIPDNELSSYEVIYPRIRIDSPNLKNSDDELSLLRNGSLLTKYKDYSVMVRGDTVDEQYRSRYYITIKPEVIFRAGTLYNIIRGNFTIPNTGLIIYLDAIQVLKENAYPQVSYTIDPSIFNMDFVQQIYKTLNQIVRINDADLKFENVRGYISELELDLDHPAEDSMTITNYKTKFEDLFATIVAQTEEMKKNSNIIGVASRLFTETGQLSAEAIQGVFYRPDLQLAFNQGKLTIDEANGIWGTSDSGVVAFRGGGIFTATQKDSNGDWLWNTGILPSGISANAITSGQLDTNLIRIYAGDNLKFQLNGDGLYAYKSWLEDNIDSSLSGAAEAKDTRAEGYSRGVLHPGQYVVHNDDGLFLVAKKDAQVIMNDGERVWYDTVDQDVNRVEISWDGLIIRNWDNEKVFYADTNGNLTVKGTIQAESGYFHGEIQASSLTILSDGENVDINNYILSVSSDGFSAKFSEIDEAMGSMRSDISTNAEGIRAASENYDKLDDRMSAAELKIQPDNIILSVSNSSAAARMKREYITAVLEFRKNLANGSSDTLVKVFYGTNYNYVVGPSIGDLFINTSTKVAYYYTGSTFATVSSSGAPSECIYDLNNALQLSIGDDDLSDSVRFVFNTSTLSVNFESYYMGDLWRVGTTDNYTYYKCINNRENSFKMSDWIELIDIPTSDDTRAMLQVTADSITSMVEGNYNNTVTNMKTQYAKSDSRNNVPLESQFSDTVPSLGENEYLWGQYYVKRGDNPTWTKSGNPFCISGPKGAQGETGQGEPGATGVGITSVVTQYQLGTLKESELDRNGWQNTYPNLSEADLTKQYLWIREKITYTDGHVQYTDARCERIVSDIYTATRQTKEELSSIASKVIVGEDNFIVNGNFSQASTEKSGVSWGKWGNYTGNYVYYTWLKYNEILDTSCLRLEVYGLASTGIYQNSYDNKILGTYQKIDPSKNYTFSFNATPYNRTAGYICYTFTWFNDNLQRLGTISNAVYIEATETNQAYYHYFTNTQDPIPKNTTCFTLTIGTNNSHTDCSVYITNLQFEEGLHGVPIVYKHNDLTSFTDLTSLIRQNADEISLRVTQNDLNETINESLVDLRADHVWLSSHKEFLTTNNLLPHGYIGYKFKGVDNSPTAIESYYTTAEVKISSNTTSYLQFYCFCNVPNTEAAQSYIVVRLYKTQTIPSFEDFKDSNLIDSKTFVYSSGIQYFNRITVSNKNNNEETYYYTAYAEGHPSRLGQPILSWWKLEFVESGSGSGSEGTTGYSPGYLDTNNSIHGTDVYITETDFSVQLPDKGKAVFSFGKIDDPSVIINYEGVSASHLRCTTINGMQVVPMIYGSTYYIATFEELQNTLDMYSNKIIQGDVQIFVKYSENMDSELDPLNGRYTGSIIIRNIYSPITILLCGIRLQSAQIVNCIGNIRFFNCTFGQAYGVSTAGVALECSNSRVMVEGTNIWGTYGVIGRHNSIISIKESEANFGTGAVTNLTISGTQSTLQALSGSIILIDNNTSLRLTNAKAIIDEDCGKVIMYQSSSSSGGSSGGGGSETPPSYSTPITSIEKELVLYMSSGTSGLPVGTYGTTTHSNTKIYFNLGSTLRGITSCQLSLTRNTQAGQGGPITVGISITINGSNFDFINDYDFSPGQTRTFDITDRVNSAGGYLLGTVTVTLNGKNSSWVSGKNYTCDYGKFYDTGVYRPRLTIKYTS